MLKRKIFKNGLIAVFILFFAFSPFQFSSFHFKDFKVLGMESKTISEDTVWGKGEHIIDSWLTIRNGATLTIEKGAIIKFSQESEYIPILFVENGKIIAEGTQDEKIVFTTASDDDQYGISFYDSNPQENSSFFRYVTFENGGYIPELVFDGLFSNKAYVFGGMAMFIFYSGKIHIENSEFKNNQFGGAINANIEETADENGNYPGSSLEIINSNFENNIGIAINSSVACYHNQEDEEKNINTVNDECGNRVILKNNWYGDFSGPYLEEVEDDETGNGEVITGDFYLEGYRKNDLIVDPVIIIPGIMGSSRFSNKWKIDPISHTYDNLIESLKKNGYQKNVNQEN